MMQQTATNPQTGEKVVLLNGQWAPYTQSATNPKTGERTFLVGGEWMGGQQQSVSSRHGGGRGVLDVLAEQVNGQQPLSLQQGGGNGGLESFLQGATFGTSDEIQGGMSAGARFIGNRVQDAAEAVGLHKVSPDRPTAGDAYRTTVNAVRNNLGYARQEAPIRTATAEVTGGVFGVGKLGQAARGAATVTGAAVRGAAGGGAASAAYGFGSAEGSAEDRLDEAGEAGVIGVAFGAAFPILGSAAVNFSQRVRQLPIGERAQQALVAIKERAQAGFAVLESSGIRYQQEQGRRLYNGLAGSMRKGATRPRNAPETFALIDDLGREIEANNLTFTELESIRRRASEISRTGGAEGNAAGRVTEAIDAFIDRHAPAGDATQIRQARDAWKHYLRAETIEELFRQNVDGVAATGRSLRNSFRTLYRNPRRLRLFNKEEREAIKRAASAGPGQRVLERVGQVGGGGFGTVVGAGAGAHVAGPLGAVALPLASMGSRAVAGGMMRGRVNDARQMILAGDDPMMQMLMYGSRNQLPIQAAPVTTGVLTNQSPLALPAPNVSAGPGRNQDR